MREIERKSPLKLYKGFFENYGDNPFIFLSKLRIFVKIGIDIQQTQANNFFQRIYILNC